MEPLENNELNPDQGIAVYTDGSCWTKDQIGGWAWVAIDAYDGVQFECGYEKEATISTMELTAVGRAIHDLSYDYGEVDLWIFSDSEYVVKGFNDKSRKRNKHSPLWYWAETYVGNCASVTMEHVKGHAGNEINEYADELAGLARKEGQKHYASKERITVDSEG